MNAFLRRLLGSPARPPWFLEKPLPAGFGVRPYQPGDLSACMGIYEANAPGRFPPGVDQDYRAVLERGESGVLVIEDAGQIVATGGVAAVEPGSAMLYFGMVRPELHGRGLGRLLLLSRLALLGDADQAVWISTVSGSLTFYERFGFRAAGQWSDTLGRTHPLGRLRISAAQLGAIREFLKFQEIPGIFAGLQSARQRANFGICSPL